MKILGLDEVGKGSLAGPLGVCGLILHDDMPQSLLDKIKDSKKLSPKKREELFKEIPKYSDFEIELVSSYEIDKHGILVVQKQVMFKIIMKLKADKIIFDGNWNPFPDVSNFETCIRGEDFHKEIAAASIMAKVARDRYMVIMEDKYPGYGFAKHKGYGTKEHRDAIHNLGFCSIHRKSWNIKY